MQQRPGDLHAAQLPARQLTDLVMGALRQLQALELHLDSLLRDIARDAGKVTAGQVEALTRIHGFSDEEVFDIAAIASARCFFTKILDALGSEPDVAFMAMDPELRRKLSVGRPISHTRLEYTKPESA